jgi:hypothetical protein
VLTTTEQPGGGAGGAAPASAATTAAVALTVASIATKPAMRPSSPSMTASMPSFGPGAETRFRLGTRVTSVVLWLVVSGRDSALVGSPMVALLAEQKTTEPDDGLLRFVLSRDEIGRDDGYWSRRGSGPGTSGSR